MKKKVLPKISSFTLAVVMAATCFSALPSVSAKAEETQMTKTEQILNAVYDELMDDSSSLMQDYNDEDAVGVPVAVINNSSIKIEWHYKDKFKEFYGDDPEPAVYTLNDEDWFVCTCSADDYWTAVAFSYIVDAIGSLYLEDSDLATGYVSAVSATAESQEYVFSDYYVAQANTSDGSVTMEIYAGDAWDTDVINRVLDYTYFDDAVISNFDIEALDYNDSSSSYYYNVGKFHVSIEGNKNDLTMTVAEYGSGFDELGCEAVKGLIKALQPTGYEDFDFSGAVPESKYNWSVYTPGEDQIPEAFSVFSTSKYTYVQVTFDSPYFTCGQSVSLKAGSFDFAFVENGNVKKYTSSNPKVAKVTSIGEIRALKKGKTTITATLDDGTKLKCKVKVTTNPTIKVNGAAFKASKTYKIKKGKTLTIKIKGKANGVKNSYASSKAKVAKVTSKKDAETVKIKGLKKGDAKITLKVNGVSFKIKVNVV